MHGYGHIVYQSTWKLPGKDVVDIKNPSDQPFGRYCPESGRMSKKTLKNGLFFKVFG